jgi:hypothetical protein
MSESAQKDIRRLLKEFGIGSDREVMTYFAENPEINTVSIRLQLVDETEYGDSPPDFTLEFRVTGTIHRAVG